MRMRSIVLTCVILGAAPFSVKAAVFGMDAGVFKETGMLTVSDARGVGSLAVHDMGTDGVAEVLVGSGAGAQSSVRVLRADGSEIAMFFPFQPVTHAGVMVAAGDLNSDGTADIAAATGKGVKTLVRAFDGRGNPYSEAFAPYDEFTGGATVAIGDFSGNGRRSIVTMPLSGGAHARVWSADGLLIADLFVFPTKETGRYAIAAGDTDGDGKDELVVARFGVAAPSIRIIDMTNGATKKEWPLGDWSVSAASVAVGEASGAGSGPREVFISFTRSGSSRVAVFVDGTQTAIAEDGKVPAAIGVGTFADGHRTVTVSLADGRDPRPELAKFIDVDVSEQRLRAFENGRLVNTFLVATGMQGYSTPQGEFSILAKPYKVNYKWSYGPGNPNNYDLGWVTWNLRFKPNFYIHYAPWRKVFGVRGSHGCVNVSKEDAQWIYEWADVGTTLAIRD